MRQKQHVGIGIGAWANALELSSKFCSGIYRYTGVLLSIWATTVKLPSCCIRAVVDDLGNFIKGTCVFGSPDKQALHSHVHLLFRLTSAKFLCSHFGRLHCVLGHFVEVEEPLNPP